MNLGKPFYEMFVTKKEIKVYRNGKLFYNFKTREDEICAGHLWFMMAIINPMLNGQL